MKNSPINRKYSPDTRTARLSKKSDTKERPAYFDELNNVMPMKRLDGTLYVEGEGTGFKFRDLLRLFGLG